MSAAGAPRSLVPPGAVPLEVLAARFRGFDVGDALYAALCRQVAARPDWLAMLWRAPPGQQLPNLWLAALHERILGGIAHPLAAYFESVGGTRAPDAALADAFADFVAQEQAAMLASIATRSTQTNEIGRCAVLWPALCHIAQASGGRDLALLDFGCSAGLNLGVDRYAYGEVESTESLHEATDDAIPHLVCRRVGPVALPSVNPAPRIVERLGIDPAPVDVNGADALRWLRACIWPGDHARQRRLLEAAALARREGWAVRREADCLAAIEPWLDALPHGVTPVVFHSWVLHYVDRDELGRHVTAMTALVRERGVQWLSAEGPHVRIAELDLPPPFESEEDRVATTLWTLCSAPQGSVRFELLARSHAHGRWVEWRAGPASTQPR
ncbi:MAG: DUF2332 domain-containing protein [Burkholderiaceae bacterium]